MNAGDCVSVVIPSKNRARRLEAALKNCLEQSYKNLEVVVVNDGSTDETESIVEKVMSQDSRVRLISNSASFGLPTALNIGFSACSGGLLTWTSDDNRYAPNAIARMRAVLESDPRLDFVYCDYQVLYSDGTSQVRHLDDPAYIIERNCVGACFLYRKEVREKVGDYCPELLLAEDYDYWLRVYLSGATMLHLRDCLYEYEIHQDSLGSLAGQEKVDFQAQASRRKRLSILRREWIRLRRRSGLIWRRFAKPLLTRYLPG